MAAAGKTSSTQASSRAAVTITPAGVRLGRLAGGAMGLLGFSLGVISGLNAGNGAMQIVEKAILASVILAVIGGLAGAAAGRVICEQFNRPVEPQPEPPETGSVARRDQLVDAGGENVKKSEKQS